MTPFDIINNVSSSHENKWDEIGTKYNSFMVNRGLSYYPDTIMLAQEMNKLSGIPDKWQYDFYLNAITPKKKRFSKWASSKKDADIQLVAEAYQVNMRKAEAFYSLMTPEQLKELKETMSTGGTGRKD